MRGHRAVLERIVRAGIATALPETCLPPFLPTPPRDGDVIVLACGKAAGSMVEAAESFYLDRRGLAPERLRGLAVTRHGHARPARRIRVVEAGHPIPDAAGLSATGEVMALARDAGAGDLVVVLLSGGGSANWVAPAEHLTLPDKQELTAALLKAGASIAEVNTVRKHLSRIKGGRLAALAWPARVVTLAISDVAGDEPSVIASGPTVADVTTLSDARAVLGRRGIRVPAAVAAALDDPANETPKPGDPRLKGTFTIVARPLAALEAMARQAAQAGFEPVILSADIEGEARVIAAQHAKLALDLRRSGRRAALLSGGELTVTVRGEGRGGPNQEYALGLALALAGEPGIHALSADSDGSDGGSGDATDPAGAFVDPSTLARAAAAGLQAADALQANDSTGFFGRLGDLYAPGPTLTNINDLRVILVSP